MRRKTSFYLIFLIHFTMFSQKPIEVNNLFKEDFLIRAFGYSKQHYFARLSYNNQTIYIQNLIHPNKRIKIFSNSNKGIKTLDFSFDENYLISGSNIGTVDVWDINKNKLNRSIKLHLGPVNRVKFIRGKLSFVSIGNDGKLFMFDLKENTKQLLGKHKGIIRDFDISQDKKYLVTIGSDNMLNFWDVERKQKIRSSKITNGSPTVVRFSGLSNDILVGNVEGILSLYEDDLMIKKKIKIHDNVITSICLLPNDEFITCSFDGSIKKIRRKDFNTKIIYKARPYIIHATVKDDTLTFADRDGRLLSIKIDFE
ncbi:hypothetical protein [Aquimarina algiphila]|uniref:hypothetical protein n=1 Tax=Aquimarina algiphila TaxID=2047982 RepID=UPI002490E921|nr:hypothetical protein [Aquimarina algiphila]